MRLRVLLLALLLSGCGTSTGRDFEEAKLGQLVKGTTTLAEAVQVLGPPGSINRSGDGSSIVTYQYTRTEQSAARMVPIVGDVLTRSAAPTIRWKSATLMFDGRGVLQDWSSQQSDGSSGMGAAYAMLPQLAARMSRMALPTPPSYPGLQAASIPGTLSTPEPVTSTASMRPTSAAPATPQQEARDGRRVALVVGNSRYRSLGQLKNSANDANLMAQTLRRMGYTLIGSGPQVDLDRHGFERAIQEFGRAIPGAAIAVFYYAGHGMQVDGTNWLVPVDADLTPRKQDLPFQMVSADHVLLQMDGAGAQLNLLILDACRNNPIASRGTRDMQSGLAEMRAPAGSMIAYATQPGAVALDGEGANGPYTMALARAMQQPDLDIFHVFNRTGLEVQQATNGTQVPWTSNSPIRGDVR